MEQLIFKLKSGIKIKPSHKGLFTKYCKGKVTSECIAKGKISSNPAIRKRATFADNVRHFKHHDGGVIYIEASPEYNEYLKYKSLSPEEQEQYRQKNEERNANIAKSYIKTPTIPNLYKAAQAYFAPVAPKNPYQQTGAPTILPSLGAMRTVDLLTRKAPALKSLINQAENIGEITVQGGKTVSKIHMVPDALQKVFKKFPNFQKNLQKFFRTGDEKLLQQLESNARQVIGNADDYLPKGSLLDDAVTQVAKPLEGLTIKKVTPGNFQNYVSNLAEREAAKDFAKAYPNIPVSTKAPVGRPSKEVMQEIMYPDSYKQWIIAKKSGGSLLPKFQQGSAMDAMFQMYQQSDEASRKLADIDQKAKEERAMKQQMKNYEMASKGHQLGQVVGEAVSTMGNNLLDKKANKIASTLTDEKILEFQGLKTDDERKEFFRKNKINDNFINRQSITNAINNRQVPEPVQAASPTSQTPKAPAQKTPAAVTNSTEIIPADDPLNANAANNNPIAPIGGFAQRLLNQFGFLRLGGKALIPRNNINK